MNRVAGGIITAVEMLSFKLRRVENGTATDVDSDITRFRPWSPIATGNHLDRTEKNSKCCSDNWHR